MRNSKTTIVRPISQRDTIPGAVVFQDIPTNRQKRLSAGRAFARFRLQTERADEPRVLGGRYALGNAIQTGGMSIVYSGMDTKTGEPVAIKVALPFSEKYNRSVRKEAMMLSALKHPGIVRFIDSGTYEGSAFLVMEHMKGPDLHDIISDYGPTPWHRAVPTLLEICDVLQFVHDSGVVHGDVKPPNIMILPVLPGEDPSLKLLDFGMARHMSHAQGIPEDEVPNSVNGTTPYLAPEQLLSLRASYDRRIDVYSLGITMYGMLTAVNPFENAEISVMENMMLVINHFPEPPSAYVPLPDGVDEIVMRAIAKDPEERFQSISEMRDAIRSCP